MKFERINEHNFSLNVEGYVCPHPQIYTKKALEKVESGDVLDVLFDNPSSGESIATMCDNIGHEIINKMEDGGKYKWSIRKS